MKGIEASPTSSGASVLPQCIPVESFFWTNHLLTKIADAIEAGTINSGEDWKKIACILTLVSDEKKTRFYRRLEDIGLSRASLEYLFDGWRPGTITQQRRPAPWKVRP